MKLLRVDTLDEARKKIASAAKKLPLEPHYVSLPDAYGKILCEDLVAEESIPPFSKSTVDGYAVIAGDTAGASDTIPTFLKCVGKTQMGKDSGIHIKSGQCVYVPTGGMLPDGADAMVMVEHCEPFGEDQISVYRSVSPGRNMLHAGDDIQKGRVFLTKGKLLRPQEIGVLATMGFTKVPVFKPWRVTILSTGDELIPVSQPLLPGQIRDSNSYTTAAQCKKIGLTVVEQLLLPDKEHAIRDAMERAKDTSDLLIVSGGSSKGEKDMTAMLLDSLGEPGIFTHGISVKPGKPTILGFDDASSTLLVGLPGHPVAAMMIFELLVHWVWEQVRCTAPQPKLSATIDTNVAGGDGRALCLLVQLSQGENGWIATPILGNSGLLSTLTHADGYVLLGMNQEGLNAGGRVDVTLL